MTITSSFFNSVGGDRVYNASNFAEYFASFIGNGVFPNPSNNFQVTAVAGPVISVEVNTGRAWIRGYYVNNDQAFQLFLPNADGVLNRIDRIVLALDLNLREINIYAKSGTPAFSPVPPSLTRNASTYELALADVRVNSSTTSITQSAITDQRPNTALCGFVTGTVTQVDTSTLFNQYQVKFEEQSTAFDQQTDLWLQTGQNTFDSWFAAIQDTLSGDVAGNLANLINDLETKVDNENVITRSSVEEVRDIANHALGLRTTVASGTNILTLPPGKYEGSSLVNSPLPSNDNGIIEIDVSMSPNSLRKQFEVTKSISGEKWSRTIHTDGSSTSGSGGWLKLLQDRDFVDSGWQNATLTTVTGTLRYRRIIVNGLSTIHVAASIRGIPSNATFTQISNLPVGYRPVQVLRNIDSGGFGPENVTRHAFMQISESGNCFISSNTADPTALYNYYFTFIL